ncbi:CvpA family protein, partial [Gammaproteobacteria bacterium]|nr:CvpA family protein [Gammaproteobacteria bacterium]
MPSNVALADLVISALVLVSSLYGLYRGLIREVISLIAWIGAFFLAIFFSPALSNALDPTWAGETLRLIFSFSAIFVGVLIFSSLIQFLISKFVGLVGLGGLDRVLGFFFGLLRGVVISMIVLVLFREFLPLGDWLAHSVLAEYLFS